MNIDRHITEITRLRLEADKLPDDVVHALMERIELLAKCLVYIGRLSSFLDGEYKRIYANRKYEQAAARIKAVKDKEATSEVFVKDLRMKEADAYEQMQRWRNAFESTQEEIHALKLRMRIDFADGGMDNVRTQSSTKATA